MTLDKDFEDFVALLNKHVVDYMIIGGYALAFHGKPRHTGDLDIWIDISDNNAQKMLNVINDFGMASLGMRKTDFLQKGIITQIGYPPLRIDILNEIDGVDFKDAYPNKLVIDVDDLPVNYIGLDDFIKNKQVSGRHQDISDVNELYKLKNKI
jgi:predicted nucleotidyltransferase